jgi:hypothetical protein
MMQIRRRVRVVEAHLQPCSMTMLYFPQLWQCRRRAPVNATRRALRGARATRSTLLKLQGCRGSEVASEANTDWRGHGPAAAEASREGKEKRRRRQRRGRSVDDVTVRTQYERGAAERVAKFCRHCHRDEIWIAMEMPSSGHLLAITAIGGRTNENTCFGAPWHRGIQRQSQFRCCLLPLPAHRKFRNILSGVLLRFGAAMINKRSSWSRLPIANTDALADFSTDLNGVTSSPINCRPPATAHQPQPASHSHSTGTRSSEVE